MDRLRDHRDTDTSSMRSKIGGVVCILVGFYVLANLIPIMFVPLLFRIRVEVTAVDGDGRPLPGVRVDWTRINAIAGIEHFDPIGTTDQDGTIRTQLLLRETPIWVFPTIGTFGFNNKALSMVREGFTPRRVDLSNDIPAVSLNENVVRIDVKMPRL